MVAPRQISAADVVSVSQPRSVCNHADVGQPNLSSGGSTQYSFRVPYVALSDFVAPRLLFSNTQITASGEITPADAITVKAAWEAADGTIYPVTFGGSRTYLLAAGTEVECDPIPVRVASGASFFVRTRPQVDTLGKKWITGGAALKGTVSGGGGQAGDVIDTATAASFNGALVPFQPVAIRGRSTGSIRPATVLLHGSSSVYGSGDVSDDAGNYGAFARAASLAKLPHVRMAAAGWSLSGMLGSTATNMMTNTAYQRRIIDMINASFVVAQMSPNDLYNAGTTLATLQGFLMRYWDFMAGFGLPIVATTWHIRTTSTDAWTTTANQTVNSQLSVQQAVNAWIKTKPHSAIIGALDYNACLEDPSNLGKWRIDGGPWTDDGIHSNAYGSVQSAVVMAPVLAALAKLAI